MATKKKTPTEEVLVDSYKHSDSRVDIPTQENSHLIPDEAPKKTKYAYDPSLDPQLVWTGKEEQKEIEVDTVPIFIQEKVSPEAIIDRLRDTKDEESDQMPLFFADRNTSADSILKFYAHDQSWANRMILGDSLLAMNSLIEKENLRGQVQTIYFDPPYGVKFGSNWQVSTKNRDVKEKEDDLTRQPEQIKAFRDTWELGIHSYLSYLRDRLMTSRILLTESGSCFVQISDENVHLVRNLMDEIFGSENFISMIEYVKTSGLSQNFLPQKSDYIIWYGKNKEQTKFRSLYIEKDIQELKSYSHLEFSDGTIRKMTREEVQNPNLIPKDARVFAPSNSTSQGNPSVPLVLGGITYTTPANRGWKTNIEGMQKLYEKNRLLISGNTVNYKRYVDDFPYTQLSSLWDDIPMGLGFGDKIYVVQTAETAIRRCLLMTTDPGDIVLDPTCGSGTTAYVAEQWGRRWITMDTSRVALALARTRLMTATYPYYSLQNEHSIKEGFHYKTVPHITLKSIANDLPAEEEILYDQPKVDKSVVRVTGPFTFESLSPHRARKDKTLETTVDWVTRVVGNMRRSGVQTGIRDERLEFTSLDTLAGEYIQAHGEYLENGASKRVALAIGPEYGSIDDDFIRSTIREASKYFDLLVIAGVSFDGSAFTENVPEFLGKMRLIKAKINPDLSMGDILKKTGTGNLFLAFGEPDITVHTLPENKVEIEVNGVDVYDATKGEVRSGKVDDIACWFIDTNYDEESFFVQHAYFTGSGKPYDKLKKALKAEIDEELWERLYTNRSRSFPVPKTGKIAVKVINHFGDEVMKVIKL